jgi:hypothetical protein
MQKYKNRLNVKTVPTETFKSYNARKIYLNTFLTLTVLGQIHKKVRKPVIHFMVPDRGASMGEKKLNYNTLTQVYFFENSAAFGH